MAKKITEEDIIKINQLYYEIGVKSKVAKKLGMSAATVSKYIIPNWKPEEERNIIRFIGEVPGCDKFIEDLSTDGYLSICKELTEEEWAELEELQKEEI